MGDILTAVTAHEILLVLADADERLKTPGYEPVANRILPVRFFGCYV
jgi:hypothetical protein